MSLLCIMNMNHFSVLGVANIFLLVYHLSFKCDYSDFVSVQKLPFLRYKICKSFSLPFPGFVLAWKALLLHKIIETLSN